MSNDIFSAVPDIDYSLEERRNRQYFFKLDPVQKSIKQLRLTCKLLDVSAEIFGDNGQAIASVDKNGLVDWY